MKNCVNHQAQITIKNLRELAQLATQFASQLKPGCCVLLEGELGTGKTTFISQIVSQLGITELVTSPSFTLVNKYQGKQHKVYHLDLYRTNNEQELYNMDLDYYFNKKDYILFVEWAEKLGSFTPDEYIKIQISLGPDFKSRIFRFSTKGRSYAQFSLDSVII
jgi:tRNA threonylcarbamoyladenosine biosynthesis protein TsaE